MQFRMQRRASGLRPHRSTAQRRKMTPISPLISQRSPAGLGSATLCGGSSCDLPAPAYRTLTRSVRSLSGGGHVPVTAGAASSPSIVAYCRARRQPLRARNKLAMGRQSMLLPASYSRARERGWRIFMTVHSAYQHSAPSMHSKHCLPRLMAGRASSVEIILPYHPHAGGLWRGGLFLRQRRGRRCVRHRGRRRRLAGERVNPAGGA